MKNQFLKTFTVLLFSLTLPGFHNSTTCLSQGRQKNDESIYNELLKADFKKYIGKPISILLNDKTVRKYKSYIGSDEPPGVLRCFSFEFSRKITIDVFPDGFHHVKQFSQKMDWKFNEFKKEKLRQISILDGDEVVKIVK
jgi:hypothetical protein